MFTKPYSENEEETMKRVHNSLNEKDKRHYAAVEAIKLGHGGLKYIAMLLGCVYNTIKKGIKEINNNSFDKNDTKKNKKLRASGAGAHKIIDKIPDIDAIFLKIVDDRIAGSPMDGLLWTNMSLPEISKEFLKKNLVVSPHVVKQLMVKHKLGRRKMRKTVTQGEAVDRNDQFKKIKRLKTKYAKDNNPIISIDTKKKETLGNFARSGVSWGLEPLKVLDHDFPSSGSGIVIPHGIYDLKNNLGYMTLGNSHDTSEFCCDNIKDWWLNYGCTLYPSANSILILADGGGSNSSRHYIFKEDLQKISDELQIEIRITHYPPYTSKYNPIEHKLFCHVTRACSGAIFSSLEFVKSLMDKTSTTTGLKVITTIKEKVFEIARQVSSTFKDSIPIRSDKYLGKWNYKAIPR
jgi:hypothetical protein